MSAIPADPRPVIGAGTRRWPAARTAPDLRRLAWPAERLGEAVRELAMHAGLATGVGAEIPLAPPAGVASADAGLDAWMAWAATRIGAEAEPVDATVADLPALIAGAGPAVLRIRDGAGGPGFLLLLPSRLGRARFLSPDGRVVATSPEAVRRLIAGPREASVNRDLARVLDLADVPQARRDRVRTLVARERLGGARIGGAWLLRRPASAPFLRQLAGAGVALRVALLLAAFAGVYALEIAGWAVVGDAVLGGRLDLGWLAAWLLLVLSVVPLQAAGAWLSGMVALRVGALVKGRLLAGSLRSDIDTVRRQGSGRLMAGVMEAQAFETQAVAGGLATAVAALEAVAGAWILSQGAAPAAHPALLAVMLAAIGTSAAAFLASLAGWTGTRVAVTQSLVERMIGHRTVLAQERAALRHRSDDEAMAGYLASSAALDGSATLAMVVVPGSWMIAGLAVLAPAFVTGAASAPALAIAVGGLLFTARALADLVGGVAAMARALVAWRQVAPLFAAGAAVERPGPFVPDRPVPPRQGAALLEAEGVVYRPEGRAAPSVRDARLVIAAGDRILVEGGSGSGKSTLASLLTGLRRPDAGVLLLDGLDRQTLGESWHALATQAPQFHANHVVSGSLAFNLLMGRAWPPSEDDLAEARALCGELGLDDLLDRMPSGLMQVVGETGWQLSHGERSRVFLARALLQGAPLTVLDESFAALDPDTFRRCLDCAWRRAATLVVIAHP